MGENRKRAPPLPSYLNWSVSPDFLVCIVRSHPRSEPWASFLRHFRLGFLTYLLPVVCKLRTTWASAAVIVGAVWNHGELLARERICGNNETCARWPFGFASAVYSPTEESCVYLIIQSLCREPRARQC